jgi:two-component system, sensor histidine kinase and response regulator
VPKGGLVESQVLDVTEGLRRFNGNMQVYASLLRRFLEINSGIHEKARQIVNGDNTGDAILFFHSLKGSTGNLSAMRMYEQASLLEKLARSGDMDAVRSSVNSFLESFDELKQAIAELE